MMPTAVAVGVFVDLPPGHPGKGKFRQDLANQPGPSRSYEPGPNQQRSGANPLAMFSMAYVPASFNRGDPRCHPGDGRSEGWLPGKGGQGRRYSEFKFRCSRCALLLPGAVSSIDKGGSDVEQQSWR